MLREILQWNQVTNDHWSWEFTDKSCAYLVYELTHLPDFTDHRFAYLTKDVDQRVMEVAKRQMNMVRGFHGLGAAWAISLRFIKKDNAITLFLVFRYAGVEGLSQEEFKAADQHIRNMLMNTEYSFHKVSPALAFETADYQEAAELTKAEEFYQGDTYDNGYCQHFYSVVSWAPTDNNMEQICRALMSHSGSATAEITLLPTEYLVSERQWIGGNLRLLRDCMNGETIRAGDDPKGAVLWQGRKMPELRTPLDNYERINKQYEGSQMFLSSVRIFADSNAKELAHAMLLNSVKSKGLILSYKKGSKTFDYLLDCYRAVDVSARLHTKYWSENVDTAPFRAQRLTRLVSLEEAVNFFRLPIPNKPGFPGFGFDTGLETSGPHKKALSTIRLGNYLDESGGKPVAAEFDSQQLAKHGLIVGVPGCGKTTAMFNILHQLWAAPEGQRIPFIVLEPAKTEYRALKTLDAFKEDMLVFTLGDESVSPFRFNPMEVLPGIRLENHISKLQACFVGAFDLFDPLPIFLEQAIRRTYQEKGWYDDSRGGDEGLETPTLSDLCRNAEYIVSHSGFDSKMRSDFQASLLERLNSLRRGSKGRMLDTRQSIPIEDLMNRPIVLELDSLNGDEKSLIMMFLLSFVYEYCKVHRKSGSPLKHMLLVEEAHNLIGASVGSEFRASPKAQTLELFVNMLAEMRALGQGILIADQLPTAIAPQAVKQTNVKVLMRITAKDDREEIGNTMDLNDEQMHQVVNFKTGHAYLYHEGEDRVRAIRMLNFKEEHTVEEPPSDDELRLVMSVYEQKHPELYLPFPECSSTCEFCNRRVRNQAESFLQNTLLNNIAGEDIYNQVFPGSASADVEMFRKTLGICGIMRLLTEKEAARLQNRYGDVGEVFGTCVYIHMKNKAKQQMDDCSKRQKQCDCSLEKQAEYRKKFDEITNKEV